MIYTSPKLECLGTIAALTASDYKCTPGVDAGWTYYNSNSGQQQTDHALTALSGPGTLSDPPINVSLAFIASQTSCRSQGEFTEDDITVAGGFYP